MLNYSILTFRFIHRYLSYMALGLLLLLLYEPDFYPAAGRTGPPDPYPVPTILELSIASDNNCNSAYAIDNDLIICEFTTLEPCYLTSAAEPPASGYLRLLPSLPSPDPHCILFHPPNDFLHWTCIYRIQNGDVPDQLPITGRSFLDWLFDGNYRYYGTDPAVIYYAPIHYSFTVSYVDTANGNLSSRPAVQLEIRSNHPIEFLPYEDFISEGRAYRSIPVIDTAGNGPCCITISLEDTGSILYNFNRTEENLYVFSFISDREG